MSEFERTPAGAPGPVEELHEEVASLRMLLTAAVALLILFSASLDLYLLKQVSLVRTQITRTQDSFRTEVQNFNTPLAIEYWNRLVQYSRTHPEYAAIIGKYTPVLNQTLLGDAAARQ